MPSVSKITASHAAASKATVSTDFDPYAEWLGISPHERPVDHYRLLGLPRFENDLARIQAAADHWMGIVRQQQIGKRAAYTQQLLNELSSAKLCLLDPRSKAEYDTRLIEAARSQLGIAPQDEAKFRLKNESLWMHGAALPKIVASEEEEEPAELPWVTMIVMFTAFAMAAIVVSAVVYSRMSAQRTATEEAKNPPRVIVVEQAALPTPETPLGTNELQQDAAGNLTFVFDKAMLLGEAAILDSPQGQVIGQLRSPNDGAQWTFRAVSAGYFLVELEYLALPGPKGKIELEITADESEPLKRTFSLRQNEIDEDATDPATARQAATQKPIVDRYPVMIKKKGTCVITVRPAEGLSGKEVLRVKSVTIRANRLKPAEGSP